MSSRRRYVWFLIVAALAAAETACASFYYNDVACH